MTTSADRVAALERALNDGARITSVVSVIDPEGLRDEVVVQVLTFPKSGGLLPKQFTVYEGPPGDADRASEQWLGVFREQLGGKARLVRRVSESEEPTTLERLRALAQKVGGNIPYPRSTDGSAYCFFCGSARDVDHFEGCAWVALKAAANKP